MYFLIKYHIYTDWIFHWYACSVLNLPCVSHVTISPIAKSKVDHRYFYLNFYLSVFFLEKVTLTFAPVVLPQRTE